MRCNMGRTAWSLSAPHLRIQLWWVSGSCHGFTALAVTGKGRVSRGGSHERWQLKLHAVAVGVEGALGYLKNKRRGSPARDTGS